LRHAAESAYPTDNPLLQITDWQPRQEIAHSKTDVFLERMAYASRIGARVAEVLASAKIGDPIARLREIEEEVLPNKMAAPVVVQLHTALIALYLGYREVKGFAQMVALFERIPPELQRKAIVREQLAFALNRMAEGYEEAGKRAEASDARQRALMALDQIPEAERTSETYGIRGRIHKGWFEAEEKAVDAGAGDAAEADAQLKRAIAVYEEGFKFDPRDYYPGVNAVTLRIKRATADDLRQAAALTPVVRFAVERAPAPKNESERYWTTATKLELAAIAADWDQAQDRLSDLLAVPAVSWMRETTAKNLGILKKARSADSAAAARIETLLAPLRK
jgi:tetratricopeptide (TPR) repeat protein